MKRPPSQLLKATAYHEAGHAVVSLKYQRSVKHVTIVPEDDCLGQVVNRRSRARLDPQRVDGKTVNWFERELLITFAGPVAESRFRGRRNTRILGTDYEYALDIAFQLHCGEVLEKYWDYMLERTRQMVTSPLVWVQIEVVANALLERGTLTGKQVRDIRREIIVGGKHRERFIELSKQRKLEEIQNWARIAREGGA